LGKTTAVLAMMLVGLAVCSEAFTQGTVTVIRIPSAGSDGEGATVGLLRVLVILGILVLLSRCWRGLWPGGYVAPLKVSKALPSLYVPIVKEGLLSGSGLRCKSAL